MKQASTFTCWVEQSADGAWAAMCPDLPGLLLAGDTREEMLKDSNAIVADYLLEMEKRGLPLPTPGEHLVEITVPA
jgi:predicted RNase H-like HicB family nuclease